MYYDSGKLQSNASFHHYSPVSLIYSIIFQCRLGKETNKKIRSTQLCILSWKSCRNFANNKDLGDNDALAGWRNLQLLFQNILWLVMDRQA